MLVAINGEDKQIHARNIVKKHVEEYRCPACQNRVIYRSGPRTIPHFAHQIKGNCQAATESETVEHLSGKNKLYGWLKDCYKDVELERYLATIKQRPDIYLNADNEIYAIEYQCSPLHEGLFLKRTTGYLDVGVVPVWIFHSHFIKRKGANLWRINSTLKAALRKSTSTFLLFYNPKQPNILTAIINMIPATTVLYYGQMISIMLSKQAGLKNILSPPEKDISYLSEWLIKRKVQLNNEIQYKGLRSILIKEWYEAGISPYKVPDFVGVPLLNGCMYSVPAIVWQGLVYIDLLKCLKIHGMISKVWIRTRFLERIKNKDIILNQSPLMKQDIFTALVEYLNFLEKIDYLEKVSVNHYIIRDDFIFDDTLEEVIKLRLYNFLKGI